MSLRGGGVVLTASFSRLSNRDDGYKNLNLRNYNGNSIMYFGNDDNETVGFLNGGEAYMFHNVKVSDIFIRGTADDIVYWNGDLV